MSKLTCWNCHASFSISQDFCDTCGKIQKPQEKNNFTLLDMPEKFDIDLQQVEKAYFSKQSRFHPDLFVTASEREKSYAIQHTSQLNNAYQILKDPLKRAKHVLEHYGISQEETLQDSELLMEMMLLREALETDREKNLHQIDQKVSLSLTALKQAFDYKDFSSAKKQLDRLKYLKRLRES